MLYELLYGDGGAIVDWPGVGLVRYVSFRAVAASITAFVLAILIGRAFIARMRARNIGEDTDKTGSPELAAMTKDKRGTPTMGGVFLIGALLLASFVWIRWDGINAYSVAGMLMIAGFAVVGLVDDLVKLRVEGSKGLTKMQKHGALTLIAGATCAWLLWGAGLEGEAGGPRLWLPFVSEPVFGLAQPLGLPFLAFGILVLTGSAHAVNLSDGLDGLAIGCVLFATLAYAGISYFVGNGRLADYLLVEHVPGSSELTVLLGALIGAGLGFLWFNAAPAQVFMGDVGSLALGGALGYAALVSRTEIVLVFVGGIFVAEAVSVILQVFWRRKLGRPLFRCAPFHHHFQFAQVPETRIVLRFWIVAALLSLSSLALFKVR